MLPCNKVNPYKVVEFFDKWKKHIPEEYREELCPEPTPEERAQVKRKKGARGEIKKFKKDQKKEALRKMEKEAFGLPGRKEDGAMEEVDLCGDCAPPTAKKSGGQGGLENFGDDGNPVPDENQQEFREGESSHDGAMVA